MGSQRFDTLSFTKHARTQAYSCFSAAIRSDKASSDFALPSLCKIEPPLCRTVQTQLRKAALCLNPTPRALPSRPCLCANDNSVSCSIPAPVSHNSPRGSLLQPFVIVGLTPFYPFSLTTGSFHVALWHQYPLE